MTAAHTHGAPEPTAPTTDPLISATALASLLRGAHPPTVIDVSVDRSDGGYASGRAAFVRDGHIPGALFADMLTELSDADTGLPFTLPRPGQLQLALGLLGVDPGTQVVLYDRLTGAWAARLWYLMRALGHTRLRVLDGGLPAWRDAGLPLSHDEPAAVTPVHYDRELALGSFITTSEVAAHVARGDTATLVCALRSEEFSGAASTANRRGHIPGSVNVPYLSLLDEHGRINRERAKELATGLRAATRETVLYCGGGINAAGLALALHTAGFSTARLYDGSLSEWFADPELPLEIGPGAEM